MTVKGYFKTIDGVPSVVYDINGMELYTAVDNLSNPVYIGLLADDLQRARQVFFENENEYWGGVMGEGDIDEVLFEMKILERCETEGCETKLVSKANTRYGERTPVRALAGKNGVEPVIGMGVTAGHGSDSDPFTIIEIVTPHHIVVKEDDWRIVSGNENDGSARYEYTPRPNGAKYDVTLRRDGEWKFAESTTIAHIGNRSRYRDPSF